jgi:hypothetical protein
MKFGVWKQPQSTSLIPILYILQLTKPLLCLACPCSNIMLAILPSILMLPLHPSNKHNYHHPWWIAFTTMTYTQAQLPSPLMNCIHYHNIHTSTNIEESSIRKIPKHYSVPLEIKIKQHIVDTTGHSAKCTVSQHFHIYFKWWTTTAMSNWLQSLPI